MGTCGSSSSGQCRNGVCIAPANCGGKDTVGWAGKCIYPKCFNMPSRKSGESSLLINGSPNSDPSSVLRLWADHFSNLGTSQLPTNISLQKISDTIPDVELATLVEEENILDTSFLLEEVDAAINRLKWSSSAGSRLPLTTAPHLCWPS